MSDDKSVRGPADAQRINVNEDYEVQYWTTELEITEEKLRETVKTLSPEGVWPSDDPAKGPASVTLASHGNGFWNSGVLDAAAASPPPSSSSVTFAAAGTYKLYCLVHPFMVGTVVVT